MNFSFGRVVGSGLIANALKKYTFPEGVLVVASGVSNSQETRSESFERERKLLKKLLSEEEPQKVVYFSTCSVYQGKHTKYIEHKLRMEELVLGSLVDFNIFRLPQVVGPVDNKTLVSHIVRNAYFREEITIQARARRSLIDVDHVAQAVHFYVSRGIGLNEIRNFAACHSTSVFDIVEEISSILGVKIKYKIIDEGESYRIPVEKFMSEYNESAILKDGEYWKHVLSKNVFPIMDVIKASAINEI